MSDRDSNTAAMPAATPKNSAPSPENPTPSPENPTPSPENPSAMPVTPRPKLFIALCLIFAAWVGVMIWMYVATVRPMPHGGAPDPSAGAGMRTGGPRAEDR